jgi:hypothetical protein
MSESRSSNDPEHKSPRESGEDSEDESEILEESPCGRWLKRREEVSAVINKQRLFSYRRNEVPLFGISTLNRYIVFFAVPLFIL